MTIASDMTSMFPVLLHLSPKGKGVRSPFPQGGPGAVRCPKLQVLGWGWWWCWTELVAAARALPEGPAGLRGQWGSQDSWVLMLGLSSALGLLWAWLSLLVMGTVQGQVSLGAGASFGSGCGSKSSYVPDSGVAFSSYRPLTNVPELPELEIKP